MACGQENANQVTVTNSFTWQMFKNMKMLVIVKGMHL